MRSSPRTLLAALLLVPLTACDGFDTHDQSPAGVGDNNQIYAAQVAHAHHYVYVARGSGNLSATEQSNLTRFIADQADGRPAAVHVELIGPANGAELAPLNRALIAEGVDPGKIQPNAGRPADGQVPAARAGMVAIDVATERWRPVLPTCPDHSRLSNLDGTNPNSANFGCSFSTNLSLMVADPRDLVQGQTGGHTDAGLTTAAIDRLEQDKIKAIQQTSSKSQ
jgi:pilus assembly protein CpaD